MNNLDKVFYIYSDLESAYKKASKKEDMSRLSFLKKSIAFNDETKTSRVDYIIDVLSEDSNTYDDEELIKFSKLTTMLKGVDCLLSSGTCTDENIEFKSILELAQAVSSNMSSITKALPEGYFTKLTSALSVNMESVELSLEDLVNSFGVLGEMFTPDKVYTLKKGTPKYFVYNDIVSLLKVKANLTEENKPFFVKVLLTKEFLLNSPEVLKHLIFLGDIYYKNNDKTLDVKIGNFTQTIKKTKSNTIKLKDCETYLVDLNLPSGTVKVVLA